MSKIKIEELKVTASEFNALNDQETTEVVGGYYNKYVDIYQRNYNSTWQIADSYYGSANNYNSTYQNNYANVYQ